MDMNRRSFLKSSLCVGAMACAAEARAFDLGRLFDFTSGSPMHGFAAPALRNIRMGIVGMGGRGQGVMERVKNLPGIEITAICDINPKKIEEARKRLEKANRKAAREYLGAEAWKALCEDENVDVVYNTTPWELHVPVALAAMRVASTCWSRYRRRSRSTSAGSWWRRAKRPNVTACSSRTVAMARSRC